MFGTSKEKLIKSLNDMRNDVCAYGSNTKFCDCKYGYAPRSSTKFGGENTGCPELRMIISLLEAMTEEEFNNFCDKAKITIWK